jgi:hypothetical protein
MRKPVLSVVLALLLIQPAVADEVEVKYRTFYGHVSKLDNEDTQALQLTKHVLALKRFRSP